MTSYSRTFSPTQILAMAGYQLDPGHSDLDNEQPMSVRVHDGLWDAVDLRCLLGDIRKAKADFHAGLRTALVASVLLSGCKAVVGLVQLISSRDDLPPDLREALTDNFRMAEALAAIAQAEAA